MAGVLTRVKQLTAITRLEALTRHTHYLALEVRQFLDLSNLYHLVAYDCLYVRLAEREGCAAGHSRWRYAIGLRAARSRAARFVARR